MREVMARLGQSRPQRSATRRPPPDSAQLIADKLDDWARTATDRGESNRPRCGVHGFQIETQHGETPNATNPLQLQGIRGTTPNGIRTRAATMRGRSSGGF